MIRGKVFRGLVVFVISMVAAIQRTGGESSPLTKQSDFIVEGRPVEYVFFPGDALVVSHAEYRLENRALHARQCNVDSCQFMENGMAVPIGIFHVYAGESLVEKAITIPPASSLNVKITFPFREVHVGINFRYAVQLNLECDDRKYEAVSKLAVIQEKR